MCDQGSTLLSHRIWGRFFFLLFKVWHWSSTFFQTNCHLHIPFSQIGSKRVSLVIEPILLFHEQVKCLRQEVQMCMVIILTTRSCVSVCWAWVEGLYFLLHTRQKHYEKSTVESQGHLHTLGLRTNYRTTWLQSAFNFVVHLVVNEAF